jgi:hypothetical protein
MAIPQPALKRQFLKNHVSGFGRKPFINGSKGEGQPTAVAVGSKEEKSANVHVVAFFNQKTVSYRPTANPPQRGVLRPPGLSSYILPVVLRPTADKSNTSSQDPVAAAFPCFHRPTRLTAAQRQEGRRYISPCFRYVKHIGLL